VTSSFDKGTNNPQSKDPLVEEQPPRATSLMAMYGDASLPTCFSSLRPTSLLMMRSHTAAVAALSKSTLPFLCSSVSFICTSQQLHV